MEIIEYRQCEVNCRQASTMRATRSSSTASDDEQGGCRTQGKG